MVDLILINPGLGATYGDLPDDAVAIEPPLWCRLLAGYVQDRGFSVKIIDAAASGESTTVTAMSVFAMQPRIVCLVAFGHQPSASTQQMDMVYALARAIRTVSTAMIVTVGGHVSALPERTLKECAQIDFACVGEGSLTLHSLLDGKRPDHVPGLVWRGGGEKFVTNKPVAPLEDLSSYHGQMWHELPMKKYRAHNWQCLDDLNARKPYASIYTSLGCPFKCSFCCINAPFGNRRYRMREPQQVIDEIRMLHDNYRVRTFKIVDEMFVLNERHYTAICNGLAAEPFADELNIWAYARVDTVRTDVLANMRDAGIKWLALGIESESAYVRDGVNKSLKREDIADVVKAIQDAGINVIANYIFGLPDDNLESMRRTLTMAMDLRTEWANFYVAMAYPGSPLYDEAVKKGWSLPDSWTGYSQHSYETRPLDTRHIDSASVLKFRDEAFNIYFSSARFLDSTLNKFGLGAIKHVRNMVTHPISRRIVDDTFAPMERTSGQ